ncbi:hypothetical protein NIES25_47080 [Nostoc linckia NIES-25]|nr:hypothetical protein NIES25_47080 [Nostoc linckia NIES-25]
MGFLNYFLRIRINQRLAIAHPTRVRKSPKTITIAAFILLTGTDGWQQYGQNAKIYKAAYGNTLSGKRQKTKVKKLIGQAYDGFCSHLTAEM